MRAGTLRLLLASVRFRVVAGSVALLALATTGSILVAREVVVRQIDDRIDACSRRRSTSSSASQQERDADTGQAARARTCGGSSQVQLARNVPAEGEAYVAYVEGEPYLHSRQSVPFRLDTDDGAHAALGLGRRSGSAAASARRAATSSTWRCPSAPATERGVFVVAVFRDFETGDLGTITGGLAGVGLVVLLLGAFLTWRTAQRVIAPVNAVTRPPTRSARPT